jgi:predicted nucleotidyltransferase
MAPPTRIERALAQIPIVLDALGARYAVVGGLAVSARAEPRLTRDVDVAVAVDDDAAAEALVRGLLLRGHRILATVEHQTTGRLATVRLLPPGEDETGVIVDLLFASCGIEPEIVSHAERLALTDSIERPVARIGHLIVMKLLARDDRRRPNDADDLRSLVGVADDGELALARGAAELIQGRGFHRGRDIPALLSELVGEREMAR